MKRTLKRLLFKIIFTGINSETPAKLKTYLVQTNTNGLLFFSLDVLLAIVFSITFRDPYISRLLFLSGFLFLISSIGLNKLKLYNLSRISTVTIGSVLVTLCAFYLGRESLVQASLLLGAIFPFVYFSSREHWQILVCLAVPVVCFCTLIFFNYNLGPHIELESQSILILLESIFMFVPFFGIVTNIFIAVRERELALEELSRSKEHIQVLFQVMTHDLSTPLNIASLTSEMVLAKKNIEPKDIYKISKALKNCGSMLNKIKGIAILSGGKSNYRLEDVPLEPFIRSIIEDLNDRLLEKDLKILLKNDTLLDFPCVKTDKVILNYQILQNIFVNAIKFSPPSKEIIVSLRQHDTSHYEVEVKDFGVGIPEDKIPKLFSWSEKTTTKGTMNESGTGYGMPLVYRFLKELNGDIQITSKTPSEQSPSSGTQVRIILPMAKTKILSKNRAS
ncbi:MAG: HAMP domain-containing histidine kinase [Bdellovibrionaceae bacterium]|nr:HAMP domain-containing histidine kinase [Pseudobdellovibrionaceae bacterium]